MKSALEVEAALILQPKAHDFPFNQSSKNSLKHVEYFGQEWPLIPKTAFYDWLYLSALLPHKNYLKRLHAYKGFTDIEFNPQKSVNCQARACAAACFFYWIPAPSFRHSRESGNPVKLSPALAGQ